ncbi:MAG: hypothetical protein HZB38_03430 [Planctomycetes bacterium]|nr:hypothetical protein [Planctomycetota bacterium]
MSTLTKVFTVLNAVMSIALSCLFIAAAAQWANWKDLAGKYQSERDAATAQYQSAVASGLAASALKDEALASKGNELGQAQSQIQDLTEKLAKNTSELTQVKNQGISAEAGRAKLQETVDTLTGEVKSVRAQNGELLKQNIDLQSRNARLNNRTLELTTNVTILQEENRNIQEKLYACQTGRGGVSSPARAAVDSVPGTVALPAPRVAGTIKGEITNVDGTYASVNIGESSGVTSGMTFLVYRGSQYLGDLVVERVRPGEAVGKLAMMGADGVRSGDSVRSGINN